ncbi:hypothetical protein FRC07_008038, partial [Ceratobasidium sp. 392]
MGQDQFQRPPLGSTRGVRPILKSRGLPPKSSMFSSIFTAVSREFESFVKNVKGVELEEETTSYASRPPPENTAHRRSIRRSPAQFKPKPYSRPSPKRDIAPLPKKRKVPGAFFSSPASSIAPTPQTTRYQPGTAPQFNPRLESVAESSRSGGVEDDEQEEGEEGEEEEEDESDQARRVRFASGIPSP